MMIPRTGLSGRAGTYGVVGTWNVRWTQVPKCNAYTISHGALPMSADTVDVLAAWHTIDELDVCHVITENAHVQFAGGYIARWTMRGTCLVANDTEKTQKLRVDVTYQTAKLTTMRGVPDAGLVAYANRTLSMQTRKSTWSIVGLTSSYRIDEYDANSHLALLTRM